MAKFRVNSKLLTRGGQQIGSASANYTDFDTAGRQTMGGTARVYKEVWLPANVWQAPAAASAHALSGSRYQLTGGPYNIVSWSPSSTTCDMKLDTTFVAPLDAASSGSVLAIAECLVNTNLTTASNTGFKLGYNYVNAAASATTSGSVSGAVGVSASLAVSGRVSGSIQNIDSFAAGGQLVHLRLSMLTGTCGAGANVDFLGLRLRYVADSLGTQVS